LFVTKVREAIHIENVTITGGVGNGQFANPGGGGVRSNGNALSIIDSGIIDNTAREAGGILHDRGALLLVNTTVANNSAVGGMGAGGGSILNRSNLLLRKSLITKNTTVVDGGGLLNLNSAVISQDTKIVDNTPNNCVPFATIYIWLYGRIHKKQSPLLASALPALFQSPSIELLPASCNQMYVRLASYQQDISRLKSFSFFVD